MSERAPRAPRRGAAALTERARLTVLATAILALHALGLGLLLAFAPAHPGLAGFGVVAYTLGLRHAFDADHIAAIDNTTRRLRQRGRRSIGVGFFFSLGHSSVVFGLTIVVALATHAIPHVSTTTGAIGATVSGTFLWVVGLLNLAVLLEVLRVARLVRAGRAEEADAAALQAPRGLLTRLGLDRPLRRVTGSWQMFPIGLLFGLGFETASEVALLAIGAEAAASGLPVPALLALPILFAAGMSAVDTADGVVMAHAYDWALRRPARKVLYNLTITLLSVVVALVVGTVQLLHVAIAELHLEGGAWDWVAGLDFQVVGYILAGLFVGTWLLALAAWRLLGLEERWSTP